MGMDDPVCCYQHAFSSMPIPGQYAHIPCIIPHACLLVHIQQRLGSHHRRPFTRRHPQHHPCRRGVDHGRVDNGLGAMRKAQRGQRFCHVGSKRAHRRQEHGFGIPTQCILEQVGELGIPVGHMLWSACLVGSNAHDDFAQRGQGAVDVTHFAGVSCGKGPHGGASTLPFTACMSGSG